jgi:hypothetical protein
VFREEELEHSRGEGRESQRKRVSETESQQERGKEKDKNGSERGISKKLNEQHKENIIALCISFTPQARVLFDRTNSDRPQ